MFHSHCKRILLKISGKFLSTPHENLCWARVDALCQQLLSLSSHQFVLVLGGGNFFRGRDLKDYCVPYVGDTMGMLATMLNSLAFFSALKKRGAKVRLFFARSMEGTGEPYHVEKAHQALNAQEIVICAGGLGHGMVSTDTTAIVRACELDCDLIIKGTLVQGVYSADPLHHPDALFYSHATYTQLLLQPCHLFDSTALVLAREAKKHLVVFSLDAGIEALFRGQVPYSLISAE